MTPARERRHPRGRRWSLCDHEGATITDAPLQAGLRYETVAWPRVQHVMELPEVAATSGFLAVLADKSATPARLQGL